MPESGRRRAWESRAPWKIPDPIKSAELAPAPPGLRSRADSALKTPPQFGMWVGRTRSGPCGGTTSRIRRASSSWSTRTIVIVPGKRGRSCRACSRWAAPRKTLLPCCAPSAVRRAAACDTCAMPVSGLAPAAHRSTAPDDGLPGSLPRSRCVPDY